MTTWMKRVRGAIGMGVVWALVWAPAAVVVGLLVDPDDSMDEMWPMIGALPGFLGGVLFSVVLAFAARRRRLGELRTGRVALWGAAAGLAVGALPFLIGDAATVAGARWLLPTVVMGTITLLSAGSAAASLAIARKGERPTAIGDGERANTLGTGGPGR